MSKNKSDVISLFGTNVFNDKARKEFLSNEAYLALKEAIEERKELDHAYADEIASGMLKWALSKGATHYTHWFQPLNGLSAEKHDAFIGKPNALGEVTYDFKGNELKGNQTRLLSLLVDFVPPLKQEATPFGTRKAQPLF